MLEHVAPTATKDCQYVSYTSFTLNVFPRYAALPYNTALDTAVAPPHQLVQNMCCTAVRVVREFLVAYTEFKAEGQLKFLLGGYAVKWPPDTKAGCIVWRGIVEQALHQANEGWISQVVMSFIEAEWTSEYEKLYLTDTATRDITTLKLDMESAWHHLVKAVVISSCDHVVRDLRNGEFGTIQRAERALKDSVDRYGAMLGRMSSASLLITSLETAIMQSPWYKVISNPYRTSIAAIDAALETECQGLACCFDAAVATLLNQQKENFKNATGYDAFENSTRKEQDTLDMVVPWALDLVQVGFEDRANTVVAAAAEAAVKAHIGQMIPFWHNALIELPTMKKSLEGEEATIENVTRTIEAYVLDTMFPSNPNPNWRPMCWTQCSQCLAMSLRRQFKMLRIVC